MSHQVTREMTFSFKGEKVTFTPDMKFLRRLHGVCVDGRTTLVEMANSIANRKPDIFTLAYVAHTMLDAGGHKVPEGECYEWVATGGAGNANEMAEFFAAVLNTVFPSVDMGKKPEGQPQPTKTGTKRKKAPAE